MRLPVYMSFCLSPLITFNQLVDFYEIRYGDHVIEGDLDAINFNPVPLSIVTMKWL
jgi:hypothetical protein